MLHKQTFIHTFTHIGTSPNRQLFFNVIVMAITFRKSIYILFIILNALHQQEEGMDAIKLEKLPLIFFLMIYVMH